MIRGAWASRYPQCIHYHDPKCGASDFLEYPLSQVPAVGIAFAIAVTISGDNELMIEISLRRRSGTQTSMSHNRCVASVFWSYRHT